MSGYRSSRELGLSVELVLIRGLPGSGKSTLARQMKSHVHVENDMYFMQHDGSYLYESSRMCAALAWCLASTKNALMQGHSVVVSNTFVELAHLKPYAEMACELDVVMHIVEARGQFKNTHAVPEEVLDTMRANWQEVVECQT